VVEAHPALSLADEPTPRELDLSVLAGKWEPPGSGHFNLGPNVTTAPTVSCRSVSYKAVIALWGPDTQALESTQGAVCAETLRAKFEEGLVRVASIAVSADGRLHLFDGHHALAFWLAARKLGLVTDIPVCVHTTPGTEPVADARLVCAHRGRSAMER
jgi:hypothetical protein